MHRLAGFSKRTNQEINQILRYLDRTDISESDRDAAERGLNDWFCEMVLQEFGSLHVFRQPKATPETGKSEVQESI